MENYGNYFLLPGEMFAERKPYKVTTILGTCVAVCLYDKKLAIGGINHFMLPEWNGKATDILRFGNISIIRLLEKMEKLGCLQENLIAKVFGGIKGSKAITSNFKIGERNIQLANEILLSYHIPVVSSSVGGGLGRKLIYYTDSGSVHLNYLK